MRRRLACLLLAAAALAAAAAAAPPPGAESAPAAPPPGLLAPLPAWTAQQHASDVALNFSAADAAAVSAADGPGVTLRGQALPVHHRTRSYHGNVAVLRFGGRFYAAVRRTQFYLSLRVETLDYPADRDAAKKWVSWWSSGISLCTLDEATLQPTACADHDPRSWAEDCLLGAGFESIGVSRRPPGAQAAGAPGQRAARRSAEPLPAADAAAAPRRAARAGPEDPRLLVWPGRGLWLMFIAKPPAPSPRGGGLAGAQCTGPWVQQPWLVPLLSHAPRDAGDAWARAAWPLRLRYTPRRAGGARAGGARNASTAPHHHLRKEKNWNAFFHGDRLLFSQARGAQRACSARPLGGGGAAGRLGPRAGARDDARAPPAQSFLPHVVIAPGPDGACVVAHETDSRAVLGRLAAPPRGNTQAVLLPAALLSGGRQGDADVYLGIFHVEVNRSYTNYLYKMAAAPPFEILQVSAPLPLVYGPHPRIREWRHIAFPASLQLLEESRQLLIGYGSGDQQPRVALLPLDDALALFDPGGGGQG
ncbi:hypothetical protein HT031_006044 [Scenedesmus sp. PABB004]|nr:hypothetical protein HT031_006044 [Scenedesmus sp. PABB004]